MDATKSMVPTNCLLGQMWARGGKEGGRAHPVEGQTAVRDGEGLEIQPQAIDRAPSGLDAPPQAPFSHLAILVQLFVVVSRWSLAVEERP